MTDKDVRLNDSHETCDANSENSILIAPRRNTEGMQRGDYARATMGEMCDGSRIIGHDVRGNGLASVRGGDGDSGCDCYSRGRSIMLLFPINATAPMFNQ